jgi:hypothetical protein
VPDQCPNAVDTSDWIALGALAVAAGSFYNSWRERADRRKSIAEERDHRQEELRLLREQVEAEQHVRDLGRRAKLIARRGPINGGSQFDRYTFWLTNGGRATARDIRLVALTEATRHEVSREAQLEVLVVDETTSVELEVPQQPARAGGIVLHARWHDEAGEHVEDLAPLKPLR